MAAPLTGISLDPHRPERVVLFCHSFAVLVDLSIDARAVLEVAADGTAHITATFKIGIMLSTSCRQQLRSVATVSKEAEIFCIE
jgi:hypothetical protein